MTDPMLYCEYTNTISFLSTHHAKAAEDSRPPTPFIYSSPLPFPTPSHESIGPKLGLFLCRGLLGDPLLSGVLAFVSILSFIHKMSSTLTLLVFSVFSQTLKGKKTRGSPETMDTVRPPLGSVPSISEVRTSMTGMSGFQFVIEVER